MSVRISATDNLKVNGVVQDEATPAIEQAQQRLTLFREWCDSHEHLRGIPEADDSRESIYE